MLEAAEAIEMILDGMEASAALTLLGGCAAQIAVAAVERADRAAQRAAFVRVAGELFDLAAVAADRDDSPGMN